jgi:oxygen-dependent protoporphyrinogen oxidase
VIAIVGAGITGLALAHELARRNREFIVLDAAFEPGGVMRTIEVDGSLLELGPQRTRLTPQLRALVAELGLGNELITAPPDLPLQVYRAGRLRRVPFSIGAALRTDLISWPGKLRILLEPLTGAARPDETVAAFLTRKFGDEAYRSFLGPLYGGLYASDPKDMPMRHSLSRALAEFGVEGSILRALVRRTRNGARNGSQATPACSFRSGMGTLPAALHAAYRDRIQLGTPVLGVREAGGRLALLTPHGTIECDDVVLTTPADVTAGLLRELAPTAQRLEELTYNPLAIVHLRADCAVRGMGFQVAFGERLETRGVTFNDSLFNRTGVYTAFLGGARHPEFVRLPDLRVGAIAAAEFELVTGCPAEVLQVTRVRMPAWDRSWDALDGLEIHPRVHLAANYESRAGVPGRLARARQLAEALTEGGAAVSAALSPQPPATPDRG